MSGAIFLKPGVNLRLEEHGVLKGSTDVKDYPKTRTRIEGHFEPWLSALVNADKVDHLQLTGKGTLDGSGAPFWSEFWTRRKANSKTTNLDVERPIELGFHLVVDGRHRSCPRDIRVGIPELKETAALEQ